MAYSLFHSVSPSTPARPRGYLICWLLFKKDISLFCSSREGVLSLATLSLMNAVVVAIGISSALLPTETVTRIAPTLIVATFFFSIMSFVEHGCNLEYRERAIDSLRVLGISPAYLFLSKVAAIALFISASAVISAATLTLLLDLSLGASWIELIVIIPLLSVGYSSLLVLLATITINLRLQGIMLPLLAIPLSFPLTLAGIELISEALVGSGIGHSSWLPLLIGANLVYGIGGLNLYEFAVKS